MNASKKGQLNIPGKIYHQKIQNKMKEKIRKVKNYQNVENLKLIFNKIGVLKRTD
jgi:hypothetical protein